MAGPRSHASCFTTLIVPAEAVMTYAFAATRTFATDFRTSLRAWMTPHSSVKCAHAYQLFAQASPKQ